MPSFVITWKPEQWPYEELVNLVRQHEAGTHARIDWRFRAHRRGQVGDKVFLLKQGKAPRGVFGAGRIVEPPRLESDGNGADYPVALIEFEELVDPFTTLLVSEPETREILPEAVINTQFSGITISDESAEALSALMEASAADRGAAQSNVPTADRFSAALASMEASGRLSEDDRDMLVCHYDAPDHTLTGRQMSALMGWGGQSANRFYGGLGRRLAEALAWVPTEREGYDGFYVSGLILGDRPNGAFEWTMRPQVGRALELLKWVKPGSDGSTVPQGGGASIIERKRYAWQKRLERDSRGAKLAKSHHGYNCQACTMSFGDVYGSIGSDFIEAHHLEPLSTIEVGAERACSAEDFAVLCSNCHRMIHRWPNPDNPTPWDIEGFGQMLRERRNRNEQ